MAEWIRPRSTCVEYLDDGAGTVVVRDSAHPEVFLSVAAADWAAFLAEVREPLYEAAQAWEDNATAFYRRWSAMEEIADRATAALVRSSMDVDEAEGLRRQFERARKRGAEDVRRG